MEFGTKVFGYLLVLPALIIGAVIHEVSHGWTAYKLGDPTAKNAGRLTLNPIAHIDPIGSVVLPLILIIMHSPILFGMAKPVPVNYYLLGNPKRDIALVSVAGAVSNVIVALITALIMNLVTITNGYLLLFVGSFFIINMLLAIFNLIPIPPLDGSKILMSFLPYEWSYRLSRVEPFGIILVLVVFYFIMNSNVLSYVLYFLIKLFIWNEVTRFNLLTLSF